MKNWEAFCPENLAHTKLLSLKITTVIKRGDDWRVIRELHGTKKYWSSTTQIHTHHHVPSMWGHMGEQVFFFFIIFYFLSKYHHSFFPENIFITKNIITHCFPSLPFNLFLKKKILEQVILIIKFPSSLWLRYIYSMNFYLLAAKLYMCYFLNYIPLS